MYTTDKDTEKRVEKEQKQVKQKGEESLHAVKKVRSADVDIPTTESFTDILERGERALEFLQNTERVQLGSKGHLVLEDLQHVMEDEVTLLQKNEGDIIQNIVQHGWKLMEGLNGDPAFKTLLDNWHHLSKSVASGGDVRGLLSSGGELMKTLRDTEAFLDLVSELISILKLFIAAKTEQVVGEGSASNTQAAKDSERDNILKNLRGTLNSLASNYIWCDILRRGRLLAHKGKATGDNTKEAAEDALEQALHTENARCLAEDLRVLLQRLAGEEVDVDPLFDSSKAAWRDITHDKELSTVLYELEDDMRQIAKYPTLADDPLIKNSLKVLSRRAESAIDSLKSNPNVVSAKEESQKVVNAIKHDPANLQLVNDAKKLWADVKSDNQGEFLDPALLSDLRRVVIPIFLEHLENVPIPPVHDTADFLGKYDYSLDNIHVSVPALIPDDIHVRINCDIDADPMKLEAHNQRTFVLLEAKDIHVHLHNVKWSYTRQSTPHLHDAGYADIDTQGHGVSIKMKIEVKRDTSEKQVLDILGVRVQVDKWDVKVMDSKHDFINKALTHMFGSKIRRQVEKGIEEKLKAFGNTANEQLIMLLDQAKAKSHDLKQLATEKIEHVKESVKDTKDKAVANAHSRISDEDVAGVTELAEEQGKGLLTLAAEKACEILTRQQEKIDQRRADITLGHQRRKDANSLTDSALLYNPYDSLALSTSIPPTPPPSPISADNLQNSMGSLCDSAVIPTATVEAYTTPYAWGEAPAPSLGFDVFPDLPSISGGGSDAKSTDSNYGSNDGSDYELTTEKHADVSAIAPRVNQQGTGQF